MLMIKTCIDEAPEYDEYDDREHFEKGKPVFKLAICSDVDGID